MVKNFTAFLIMAVILVIVATGVSTYRTYCPNATYLKTTTTTTTSGTSTITTTTTTIITTTDVSCVISTRSTPVLLSALAVMMALAAIITAFRQIQR